MDEQQYKIPSADQSDDTTIDISQVASILLANWHWLVSITIAGLIAGFIASMVKVPTYQASALLQVNDQVSSESVLSSISKISGGVSQASPTEIQMALIHSRFILDPVTKGLHLNINTSPITFPIIGKFIQKTYSEDTLRKPILGLKSYAWGGEHIQIQDFSIPASLYSHKFHIQTNDQQQYTLYDDNTNTKILQGTIGEPTTSSLPEYSGLSISIAKLTANPGTRFSISAEPVSKYSKTLSEKLTISDKGGSLEGSSNKETGVLETKFTWTNAQEAQQILNSIITTAQQQDIDKKAKQASKSLSFIKGQLPTIQKDLAASEAELNNYRSKSSILDISAESKLMLTQLVDNQNAIEQLKLEKAQLLQNFTKKHPVIIAINKKINDQQNMMDNLEQKAKSLPHSDQKAISLMRNVKVKETLYSNLLAKVQELDVIKAGTIGDIIILNTATLPLQAQPSHKSMTILASGIAGFMLTAMLLLAKFLLLSGEVDPEKIEKSLNIPVNAVLPFSREQHIISKEAENSNQQTPLLSNTHSTDSAIESLRSLRTSLQLQVASAKNNIITIMGASPSIGKSFATINLAAIIAETTQRVLVIETDIRKGKLKHYITNKKAPGLTEYLQGTKNIEAIIQPVQHNLDAIIAGSFPKNPSILLNSPKLEQLLSWAKNKYNLIVIDTAPIMAVTDALIVAKHSGINLMLIGLGKNKIPELQATVKQCKNNSIEIHGLVCNYHSSKIHSYAASKYGYYYYSYEKDKA